MKSYIRLAMGITLACLLTCLIRPSYAHSPVYQENTDSFVIIDGNTVMAFTPPTNPEKKQKEARVLGSLARDYSHSDYYPLLAQYPLWDANLMYRIMGCESSYNPRAIGDRNTAYHSYGLLQVRNLPNRNYSVEELFDPARNIEIAYGIYLKQGYWAWTNCFRRVR